MDAEERNTVEEARLEAGLAAVLALLPEHARWPVRAFLLRALYGRKWAWIAGRLGMADQFAAMKLGRRGEVLLNDAIARGRLDRDRLRDLLRAHAPEEFAPVEVEVDADA